MRVPWRAPLVGASVAAVVAVCAAGPRIEGTDPMIGADLALFGLLAAWLVLVVQEARVAWHLGRALAASCIAGDAAGTPCRIVRGAGQEAFVLGVLRPTIYVGERLAAELSPRELRAVVLHEEYHRRTRAPLRAAALRAMLRLAAPSRAAQALLANRLADLERAADAFAMGLGASPATLAAALIRVDAAGAGAAAAFGADGSRGTAFGAAADRRVDALLAAASGRPVRTAPLPPLEWLVPVVALVVPLACYLMGLVPPA